MNVATRGLSVEPLPDTSDSSDKVQFTHFEFSRIKLALDSCKGSLERLCLSHDDYYPFAEFDEQRPLNFNDYPFLRHFRAAPVFLYGGERLSLIEGTAIRGSQEPPVSQEEIASTRMLLVESLPSGIETLGLEYCNDPATLDRLIVSLREFLASKDDRFPHLRQVSIHTMNGKAVDTVLEILTSLPWKAKGVRFVVRYQAPVVDRSGDYYGLERPLGWDDEVEWTKCRNKLRGAVRIRYDSHDTA